MIKAHIRNGTGELLISGRFDFRFQPLFHEAQANLLAMPFHGDIEVNMEHVEYLDSSALGMLLLLRERAKTHNKDIRLTRCTGMAHQIIMTANFHKLMEVRCE